MHDIISDSITRIRNAYRANLIEARLVKSKIVAAVMEVLKGEGYISDYTVGESSIEVSLSYTQTGRPAISEITRVSKPGKRIYTSIEKLPGAFNHLGIFILSTPKGVLSDREARKNRVGGEILCKVF